MQFLPVHDALEISKKNAQVNNEKVNYSCAIVCISDSNKRINRGLCVTEHALYILENETAKRRVSFLQIEAITTSMLSMEFVLHIEDGFDMRLTSAEKRTEIIEVLIYLICNNPKRKLNLKYYEIPQLNLASFMTSENNYKNKKIIRPPEKNSKAINFEKYIEIKKMQKARSTTLRNKTVILVQNSKDKIKDISIEDFELLKILGKGTFGTVFLGLKKGSTKLFAIKRINKSEIVQNSQLDHTKAEKEIMSHVNHKFLVSLEYAFQTGTNLYFVVEFMKGGELTNYVRREKRFNEKQARFYAI